MCIYLFTELIFELNQPHLKESFLLPVYGEILDPDRSEI